MSMTPTPSTPASQPPQSGYIPQYNSAPAKGGGAGRGCLSGFIGFVLLFLLNITYFLYMLVQISDKPFLMKIGTDTLGAVYDANPEMFSVYTKLIEADFKKGPKSQPIPELNITVTKNEIAGMNEKEVIIFIATNKVIDPIYEKGDSYAQSIVKNGENVKALGKKKKIKMDTFNYDGVEHNGFYFLSREFHNGIMSRFYIFGGISLALLAALVLINTSWGRFSAVGITLVLSSLPMLGIYFGMTKLLEMGDWMEKLEIPSNFVYIFTKLLDPFLNLFRSIFLVPLIGGGALIGAAVLISILAKSSESQS